MLHRRKIIGQNQANAIEMLVRVANFVSAMKDATWS